MRKYIKTVTTGLGSILFLICSVLLSIAAANDERPEISSRDYIAAQIAPVAEPQISVVDRILEKSKSRAYFKAGLNAPDITDTECLAFALYSEARGEGMYGITAVAFVIHNRFDKGTFGSTYCDIIKAKGEFWTKVTMPHNVDDSNTWDKIVNLSYYLINGDGFTKIESPVGKALYFNSLPDQSGLSKKRYIKTIGNHHFYR